MRIPSLCAATVFFVACASHRQPLLPGNFAVQFDPAAASSSVTSIAAAGDLDVALEAAFRSRMESVDFVSINPPKDQYDAVVLVQFDLPRQWRLPPPSMAPGSSVTPAPKPPTPVLRYQIIQGGRAVSSGSVKVDVPDSLSDTTSETLDRMFADAADRLATRVVRDLNGLVLPPRTPPTQPVERTR